MAILEKAAENVISILLFEEGDTTELVVTFLSLLELMKRRESLSIRMVILTI